WDRLEKATVALSRAKYPSPGRLPEAGADPNDPREVRLVTDGSGQAQIDAKRLADGPYKLSIETTTTTGEVGPDLPPPGSTSKRIWRPLEAHVTVRKGKIVSILRTSQWGEVWLGGGADLVLGLQPVWMKSPFGHNRNGTAVDTIVIHSTEQMS